LDSYDGIVGALETHAGSLRSLLESKADDQERKLTIIRYRLMKLAEKTGTIQLLSKDQQLKLVDLLKAAGLSADGAARLRSVNGDDVREANKLSAVAADTLHRKRECENCIKNSAWMPNWSFGVMLGALVFIQL
jgi:hypothetical protein